MEELMQFFITTASISGEHLTGLLVVGIIISSIFSITAYQILTLVFSWLRHIKPININKIEKIEKIVEVPKYIENPQYKEIIIKLEELNKKFSNTGVNF